MDLVDALIVQVNRAVDQLLDTLDAYRWHADSDELFRIQCYVSTQFKTLTNQPLTEVLKNLASIFVRRDEFDIILIGAIHKLGDRLDHTESFVENHLTYDDDQYLAVITGLESSFVDLWVKIHQALSG